MKEINLKEEIQLILINIGANIIEVIEIYHRILKIMMNGKTQISLITLIINQNIFRKKRHNGKVFLT